ncbi:uncharacterized protein LOC108605552 [Drosophila busckii]|uniref:uncharacterized protein LOC108605552 n=1 Tax=Drosophila busckii TaxID=30019 RepID=UPI00083EED51|nr:uncharacterized protein LOC108605552 [Drosophila busckii]
MNHRRQLCPLLLFVICSAVGQLQAAAIICSGAGGAELDAAAAVAAKAADGSDASDAMTTPKPKPSEVNQFLHSVQCTLEKAKPWIEDLEKEAKRLEETAKRVGLSIVHRFGSIMDTLLGAAVNRPRPIISSNSNSDDSSSSCCSSSSASPSSTVASESTSEAKPSTDSPINIVTGNEADNEIK